MKNLSGFQFGLEQEISDDQLGKLLPFFEKAPVVVSSVLGGRRSVATTEIESVGPVVIKHYMRGGLLRFLVQSRFFRWGPSRSEQEFELLRSVRTKGIRAPEPVLFATKGSIFYRGWLVMKEISNRKSLAEMSLENEEQSCTFMKEVVEQVQCLIENKIHHVDLHPGNVLIDGNETLFLIDFDKATDFKGTKNELRDRYLNRWRRAVIKHGLPDCLNELLCAGLRKRYQ